MTGKYCPSSALLVFLLVGCVTSKDPPVNWDALSEGRDTAGQDDVVIPEPLPDITTELPQDVGPDTPADATGGGPCDPCTTDDDCGGPDDYCLRNDTTGEVLCGKFCNSDTDCPAGYTCYTIGGIAVKQCAPTSGTCGSTPEECDPPCTGGQVCRDGVCVDPETYEAELQHCVDVINEYRATVGKGPLGRASDLEACASEGAQSDSATGSPHGHFISTGGCGGIAYAENECPDWPISMGLIGIIDQCLAMMWDEGPGGGHYENMIGPYSSVGCGIYVTTGGGVWCVQDFR